MSGKFYNAGLVSSFIKGKNFYFPNVNDQSSVGLTTTNQVANGINRLNNFFTPVQNIRPRTDHSIWKKAIEEAERRILPYRASMQEIYTMTVLNGHVASCLQKRKDMVLLKDFELVNSAGEVDEIATKELNKAWFNNIMNYIIEAQFFGYSLVTFGNLTNGNFKNVQLVRRDCVSPDRKTVASMPRIPGGIQFDDPNEVDDSGESAYDWCLYVSTPTDIGMSDCGYGLLYKVSLYEITLRNIIGWNSDYIEQFGQPLKWAKTSLKNDEAEYLQLQLALQNLGSNGYLMTDEKTELEFVGESGGSGTGWKSYENLEMRCMKTISKLILGHADAMDSVPGRLGAGQGEKSETQIALKAVEKTDVRFVTSIINDDLLPKLAKLGFKVDGLTFQFKNDSEKQEERDKTNSSNNAASTWIKTLSDTGFKLKKEAVAEFMEIPVEDFEEKEVETEEKTDESEISNDEIGFSKTITARLRETYGSHKGCKHG